MSGPDPHDLENLQRFMCSAGMVYNMVLIGDDMDIWVIIVRENSHANDLFVLRERGQHDMS